MFLKKNYIEGKDFKVNNIKQKNSLHENNEELKELRKHKYKYERQIIELEQKLNHNKRNYE